jgi:hypothetical protein
MSHLTGEFFRNVIQIWFFTNIKMGQNLTVKISFRINFESVLFNIFCMWTWDEPLSFKVIFVVIGRMVMSNNLEKKILKISLYPSIVCEESIDRFFLSLHLVNWPVMQIQQKNLKISSKLMGLYRESYNRTSCLSKTDVEV